MTQTPTASVIVVSRGRPKDLRRCLIGLSQLYHPDFELVVVADPPGLASARAIGLERQVKLVAFDEANISQARNLGLAAAGGEVVAFIDDDAVPEPTWLDRLIAPFTDPKVAAATGFVRGRNGISFQWRAMEVDAEGRDIPLTVPESGAVLAPREGFAVKTVGTNAAFRRSVLAQIGGFDPAYRFFLDETDVNMRLARLGVLTAIVPLAQVHHGFAPSATRRADRAPVDLHEIGASAAVFLRKFSRGNPRHGLARFEAEQERRIDTHIVSGALEPRDIKRLIQSLRAGFFEGLERRSDFGTLPEAPAFRPWKGRIVPTEHRFVPIARLGAEALDQAESLRRGGAVVTLCQLRPGFAYHRMGFDPAGFWVQRGGLWGRSDRSDALVRIWRRAARFEREKARILPLRDTKC